jgi:hypothetical protein
VKGIVIT